MNSKYKIGYDHQSVQSVAGKLSCKKTALKCCTKIAQSIQNIQNMQRSNCLLLLLLFLAPRY